MRNIILDQTPTLPQRVSANVLPVGTFYKGFGKCVGVKISETIVFLFTDAEGKTCNGWGRITGEDTLLPVNATLTVSL